MKNNRYRGSVSGRWAMVWPSLLVLSMMLAGTPACSEPGPGPMSFSALVKDVGASVVNIGAVKVMDTGTRAPLHNEPNKSDPLHEFFQRFFGRELPKQFKQRGLGSGFIIDTAGHILTNNHVVARAEEIEVTLSDDTSFPARVVGRDPETDLALIKIDTARKLPSLSLGNSDNLEVGDWVVAVGSPFGLGNTVTAGIVSAKYRRIGASVYDDFIQTDASINPGNSGGPLLNREGEVIGINTAIFSRSGGNIGIGFAVPANIAKDLLPQLKEGKVVRGWLGVGIQELTPELREKLGIAAERGALVSQVTTGGPADKAGIRRGDVITAFDGKKIDEVRDLPYMVARMPVGAQVPVEITRKNSSRTLTVEIGELDEGGRASAGQTGDETPNLGIVVREITPDLAERHDLPVEEGLAVVQVAPGSAAAEAGLTRGDVIVEVEQQPVVSIEGFKQKIGAHAKGDTILLLVNREGATRYVTLEMG
jgi:serine protease Do